MDRLKNGLPLPELLAPAGNMERLKTAFNFGADAVYVGLKSMSLRGYADNFTAEELIYACEYAHGINKKVYVAFNAFARDEQIAKAMDLFADIRRAKPDALIVSDPGIIAAAKEHAPEIALHLSTQANTLNSYSARFWHDNGIKRIVLARELTFEQIKYIRDNTPPSLELEMFVHGAMCVSYSGRCMLSKYISGRDANNGECAQPCRWSFEFREKGKDTDYYCIEQNEEGSYIFNSNDLMLIEHLDKIIETGIASIKIEGRMKSVFYVASAVNAYRTALNCYKEQNAAGLPYNIDDDILKSLDSVSHRPYSTGFVFDGKMQGGQASKTAGYTKDSEILAIVISYDPDAKTAHIEQRNRFFDGDTLKIVSPGDIGRSFKVEGIFDGEGNSRPCAPHPQEHVRIGCVQSVKTGDILIKA